MERKEQLLEAVFGTMRSRQGTHCHVATSPRRDVGSTIQKSTIRQRRDVTTSRRQLENLHLIIKCQTARKLGHREAYDQRHGIPEQSSTVFEEVHGIFVSFFVFLTFWDIRTMFSVLNDFIFSFIMF